MLTCPPSTLRRLLWLALLLGAPAPAALGAEALPAPSLDAITRFQTAHSTIDRRRRAAVEGVVERLSAPVIVALSAGAPTTLANPSPRGLRLRLAPLPTGATLRLTHRGGADQLELGPSQLAQGGHWTPTLIGEEITVELLTDAAPTAALEPSKAAVTVTALAHWLRPITGQKQLGDLDSSGPCQVDVACLDLPAPIVDSGAKVTFLQDELINSCSGTLLNDTDPTTRLPYLLTAGHCINDNETAASSEFFWFWQKASCNGQLDAFETSVGATVLAAANGYFQPPPVDAVSPEYALLRLRTLPPAGVTYSGWSTSPPTLGEAVVSLHHPLGDAKKGSLGSIEGLSFIFGTGSDPAANFIRLIWDGFGATAPGSSGGGLWRVGEGERATQLVGLLAAANSSCLAPQEGRDYFTRFDRLYEPLSLWLDPSRYSMLWWNPDRFGQGVFLLRANTSSGERLQGAWYLYDRNGAPLWLVFDGALTGRTATAPLTRFRGPPLGSPWEVTALTPEPIGEVEITIDDLNNATWRYRLENSDSAASFSLTPFDPNALGSYGGFWWDPATPGQGVHLLHQSSDEGDALSGAWYFYDQSGRARWLVFGGELAGQRLTDVPLLQFTGPALGGEEWQLAQVKERIVGSATLALTAPGQVTMRYSVEGIQGELALVPFAP